MNLKVRYAETDQMGVVYYANYLVWMEVARTEWFERSCGLSYAELEKRGLFLPVLEVSCRYLRPVYYPERVVVDLLPSVVNNLYLVFNYRIRVESDVRAEGFSRHVFLGRNRKVYRIGGWIKDLLVRAGVSDAGKD